MVAVGWQRVEGAVLLAASAMAYGLTQGHWGLFAFLFLVPDLSMLGYLAGPRIGAISYNTFHALIGPVVLGAAGLMAAQPLMIHIALIWLAHIGFDRGLGYGLKSPDDFHTTHMGLIGKGRAQ